MLKWQRVFGPRSFVGAVHERHMQLQGMPVGDEAFITEHLVDLAEQKLSLGGASPQNVGTTTEFPLDDVTRTCRG